MSENYRLPLIAVATLLVAVLAAGVVGLGVVGADEPTDRTDTQPVPAGEESSDRTIAVSATGTASAAPDEAAVRVTVIAEGAETSVVRDELAANSTELESHLEELGVEYRTTGYEIETPPAPRDRDVSDAVGRHSYEVTVNEPDQVGDVVDAAATAGAEIDGIDLTLSEATREQLRETAIERAMGDARTQAETIAETGTPTLGDPVSVDATQSRFSPVRLQANFAAEAGDAAPTEIATGDVSVTYGVEVVYRAASE